MNKKGFAISVVLYSIVFLLITVLYTITGILRTRYHVESDLRDAIVEQINDSVNKRIRCHRVEGSGTVGTLTTGDEFLCDTNGDNKNDPELEKFYYISNYYNQESKTFDPSVAVLIHSLNSYNGNAVDTESTVKWSNSSTVNNGPTNIDSIFASTDWLNLKLRRNPRSIFSGYGASGSKYLSFKYSTTARLLTVEEFNNGCNPISKCSFLFNSSTPIGNGIWLENIASPSNLTAYIIKASTQSLSTATVTDANNVARAVIDVTKDSIAY